MADSVAWASLIISAFSAVGVLYLIWQRLYEAIPWLSYKFVHEALNSHRFGLAGALAETMQLNLLYNFTVWNRTSQTQRLQCSLLVPTIRRENEFAWSSLIDERMSDRTTSQPVDRYGFDIRPGEGRKLLIQGGLRERDSNAEVLEFSIADSRLGWRHWTKHRDLEIPRLPPPQQVVPEEVSSA
ncbi:MAG: hypothetical protein L3K23_02175 [Thermoplasmata archaeon]|nr:hypothetical protein [Thermoplasmata archaeon]